jgi:hypothetical protein
MIKTYLIEDENQEEQEDKSMILFNSLQILVKQPFNLCCKVHHSILSSPINEKIWELYNKDLLESIGVCVEYESNGSHMSGMDLKCSFGSLSNKSAKYTNKDCLDISSYRLTSVCSEQDCGSPEIIIEEIMKRKNFDYYSIIARKEEEIKIDYQWFLIPSDAMFVNPQFYQWFPLFGKRGKKKDVQVGWTTNELDGSKMSISFAMSSQLWMHLSITEEIKNSFLIAETCVLKNDLKKLSFVELAEKLNL